MAATTLDGIYLGPEASVPLSFSCNTRSTPQRLSIISKGTQKSRSRSRSFSTTFHQVTGMLALAQSVSRYHHRFDIKRKITVLNVTPLSPTKKRDCNLKVLPDRFGLITYQFSDRRIESVKTSHFSAIPKERILEIQESRQISLTSRAKRSGAGRSKRLSAKWQRSRRGKRPMMISWIY